MTHIIEPSTLRILNSKGQTVGTGFLVAPNLAVTCAHVVIDANSFSGETIKVQFTGKTEQLDAVVIPEYWGDLDKTDVAFLRLSQTPDGIKPVRLGLAEKCQPGSPFYSFGYTKAAGEQGLGTDARIITLAPGSHFLQLSSEEAYYGMSGAPVYDKERKVVVGMIDKGHAERQFSIEIDKMDTRTVKGTFNADLRTGITYAIPTETLQQVCPEIELYQPRMASRSPLVEGINRLPYDYFQRIESFLAEYLGSETRRIPFGGRDASLGMLKNWLEKSSAPYFLLAAPAGRGKSALLVRWLNELLDQTDLALAFVPISIRFGTNMERVFYASLAARLAFLHNDEVPANPETSTEVYRGLVSQYLGKPLEDGRTLLVVLDGLDEAADWQAGADFMPASLPPEVRVLVSARFLAGDNDSTPWLRRLNWDRNGLALAPSLDPLDKPGVADVLDKMGCPLDELSWDVNIVSELHRLSAGDPLLVRLYVDDLWTRGKEVARLNPKDLNGIVPGYKGFFDRWWGDQKKLWGKEKPWLEEHVSTVLNLLSGALGSLKTNDLCTLAPELKSRYIADALEVLGRFIIGNNEKQGYTFSHPKLGQYFWESLPPQEQKKVEQCFLDWCEQTLNDFISGERTTTKKGQIPAYVITNYTAHLLRASQPIDKFLPLVQHNAWAQAWFALEGAYGGYSQDVQRVWEQCRILDRQAIEDAGKAPYIGQQIRCGLIEASLHSLAGNIPAELIPILVQQGIWTLPQTWVFIRQMPDEKQKADTIIALIPRLDASQQFEALEAGQAIKNESYRASLLSSLAQRLPEGELSQVLEAARAIDHEGDRARVLSDLAQRLPEVAREALDAARSIQNEGSWAIVLSGLAQRLPAVAREALEAAHAIQDEGSRARVLSALAQRLPERELGQVLEAARAIDHEWSRAEVLSALAQRLSERELGQVLEAARAIDHEESRAKVLSALAQRLPAVAGEALEVARTIQDKGSRAGVLSELAQHLPDVAGEALEVARTIQVEGSRARVLSVLAQQLPEVAGEALEAARAIHDEGSCASMLSTLAQRLPEAAEETLEAAHAIQDEEDRARVLSALAQRLPAMAGKVLEAAGTIQNEGDRTGVLSALAQHLPERELNPVLEAARAIQDKWSRARVLSALAQRLPAVAGEALEEARMIQNQGSRAGVLSALAQHLPEKELNQVLEAGRAIQDKGPRAGVLSALALRLPAVVGEALDAVRAIHDEGSCASMLSALAQHLPADELDQVLEAARAIHNKWSRARVLSALAERLPAVAGEALEAARAIYYEGSRASALSELAQHLRADELGQVLEAAREIHDEGSRASALHELTQHLRADELGQVLEAAHAIHDKWSRASVLSALAQRLPAVAGEVLDAARMMQSEGDRARVLSTLAQHLPDGELGQVLEAARAIQGEEDRTRVLSALAQRLPEVAGEALEAARAIQGEGDRTRVLSALAQPLVNSPIKKVYFDIEPSLGILALRNRANMYSDLSAMLPVFIHLGINGVDVEILQAVCDVSAWWR